MISTDRLIGSDAIFADTDRLVLKRVAEQDRDNYLRVNAFMSACLGNERKKFEDTCWEKVCNGPDIMFSIFEKTTGNYIGNCQYILGNPDVVELGITLDDIYQHKGYGFEASCKFVETALNRALVPYVVWRTRRMNEASQRLAERLGGVLVEVKPAFATNEEQPAGTNFVSNPLLDVLTYHIARPDNPTTV